MVAAGSWLAELGVRLPVLAAPMAGGPTTPALVSAAARAGSLGQLAAGYQTPEVLAEQVREVRAGTSRFGVNLFAPNPVRIDRAAFRRYRDELRPEAARYGIDLGDGEPIEDDDHWAAKIEFLLAEPVPLVSFTFGIPDPDVIRRFHRAGTITVQTVTSVTEARAAAEAGVRGLAVQGAAAGGHYGTLTPARRPEPAAALPELVAAVRAATSVPVVAAGGLATSADIDRVVRAGADAAMVGTVLLRAPESGASAVHRAALADPARTRTVVTRAFTGRPARGLANEFIAEHDGSAPSGYPALHHLTRGLRRAAAAAGDPERVHLWAGTGYRQATADPVAVILERLAG